MSSPVSEMAWPKTLLSAFIGTLIGISLLCVLHFFAKVNDPHLVTSFFWVACVLFPIFAVAGRTLTGASYGRVLLVNLLTSACGATLALSGEVLTRVAKGEAVAWDRDLLTLPVILAVIPLVLSRWLWSQLDVVWSEMKKLW